MGPLLEVNNIYFAYTDQDVLAEISLQIREREVFFLLGPNGCGKTTLLDCILGILKPRHGSIYLNNVDIRGLGPERIAKQIAYVPQNHDKTFPYTVKDMVLMGRAAYIGIFSAPSREDLDMVDEALERVGIIHLRNRRYTQLSGGEGQLVMIARALAQKTPLIVMDEPTAHLDFRNELVILETIVDLVRNTGLSVIMATHFPNHCFYFENSNITTRVALMNGSRFLGTGCPTEILSEENLKEIYSVNTRVISCIVDDWREYRQVIPVSTIG